MVNVQAVNGSLPGCLRQAQRACVLDGSRSSTRPRRAPVTWTGTRRTILTSRLRRTTPLRHRFPHTFLSQLYHLFPPSPIFPAPRDVFQCQRPALAPQQRYSRYTTEEPSPSLTSNFFSENVLNHLAGNYPSSSSSNGGPGAETWTCSGSGARNQRPLANRSSPADYQPWRTASSWRRGHSSVPQNSGQTGPGSSSRSHSHTTSNTSSLIAEMANSFAALAELNNNAPKEEASGSPAQDSTALITTPTPTAPSSATIPVTFPPTLSPQLPIPAHLSARKRYMQLVSKKLHAHELTLRRVLFVKNPDGEKSWRGHPGVVIDVNGHKALVTTLTTWGDKTCEEKWAHARNPTKYREWFLLFYNGTTENHDGLPVMFTEGDKKLPKGCYVDCKRTHWLDLAELEKFRYEGETEYFVTEQSLEALKRHLVHLETVETPWVDEKEKQRVKIWGPTNVYAPLKGSSGI